MVFTTEEFLEVPTESWPELDLNPQPLNSIQTLKPTELSGHIYKYIQHTYIYIHIATLMSPGQDETCVCGYTYIYIYIYIHIHIHIYIYTLRELIFAGINFHKFREFLRIS